MSERSRWHEIPLFARTVASLSGLAVLLTACSSIETVDEIARCGKDATPVVATFPGNPSYDESTDPGLITDFMQAKAEEVQKSDETELKLDAPLLRKQVVGLGVVACESNNDQAIYYLTAEGSKISREMSDS